ncbi:MAG: hypothetical protein AAF438_17095 [Pseudomonadota bacterium]
MNNSEPTLFRITFFVEDLETQTSFYSDSFGLEPIDVRNGWSEYRSGDFLIAFHKGKGRKPRLEFRANGPIGTAIQSLEERGVKFGAAKEIAGVTVVEGKDPSGLTIQLRDGDGDSA